MVFLWMTGVHNIIYEFLNYFNLLIFDQFIPIHTALKLYKYFIIHFLVDFLGFQ